MVGKRVVMPVIAAAALCLASGCDTPEMKGLREENQKLNSIIIKYEKENRDLMGQVEDSEVKMRKLQVDIQNGQDKVGLLRRRMDEVKNAARLTDKIQHQLEILAEKLGGTLVGNRLQLPGDLFFASGQFDLRPEAKAALKELVDILKSENLFLMVVGYTDNDPIKSAKKRGIVDNRHLSVMRAIAVLRQMNQFGYPADKMYPTGWGELYPLTSNASNSEKARNRRVEILIDPAMSGLMSVSAITGVESAAPAPGPAGGEGGPVTVE